MSDTIIFNATQNNKIFVDTIDKFNKEYLNGTKFNDKKERMLFENAKMAFSFLSGLCPNVANVDLKYIPDYPNVGIHAIVCISDTSILFEDSTWFVKIAKLCDRIEVTPTPDSGIRLDLLFFFGNKKDNIIRNKPLIGMDDIFDLAFESKRAMVGEQYNKEKFSSIKASLEELNNVIDEFQGSGSKVVIHDNGDVVAAITCKDITINNCDKHSFVNAVNGSNSIEFIADDNDMVLIEIRYSGLINTNKVSLILSHLNDILYIKYGEVRYV